MKKISVLALILALMMLLGGCAAKDDAVVIDVNGETMTKGAMNEQIDAQISYNQQLNALYQAYYGFSADYPTDREEVAQTLADAYINTLVALQKAKEMGLDQFDEAEKAAVETSAKAQFDGIIADVAASYFADFSGDEATEKAIAYAAEKGVTLDSYIDSESKALMLDKLEQEIIRQVGDNYIFAQLHENTIMIVTRFPHVEQEVIETWCSELIESIIEELHFELKEDALIVTLGDSKEMDSRDFFALYSRTIAKIYNSYKMRK